MNNEDKKLDKFLNFAEDPKLAVYDELIEIGENLDELSDVFENVDLSQLDYIQGEKGDKGDNGEKGDKGDTGDKGLDGVDGKDGLNGADGLDGLDGKDGKDGLNGKDGKDGSPDAPEDIVTKLESLSGAKRLKATAIQGIEDFVKLGKDGYPKNLPQPAASQTYKLNGTQTGRGNILNIVGTGITSSTDGDTTTYDLSGLAGSVTPTNGLELIGSDIGLGGTLIQDTTITGGLFSWLVTGFNVSMLGTNAAEMAAPTASISATSVLRVRTPDVNDAQATVGHVLTLIDAGTGESEFAAVPNTAVWGSITGTLSDQTDLQTALDAKASIAYVDEQLAASKLFNNYNFI